jgi:hypothetical protein
MAATPTRIYTMRASTVISPNSAATRSNSNRPTSSQFSPPMINRMSAIQFIVVISKRLLG